MRTLTAFALGGLSERVAGVIAAHLEVCAECEECMGQLDGLDDTLLKGLRRATVLGRNRPGRDWVCSTTETFSATGPPDRAAAPVSWGDFRIVREIGRGGMGVVYEALQGSLNRHVALKLLPGHGNLARFRREARAAGRLHHTNIVPVFGVGEHQGRHFYIMQFISGRGLDAILKERARAANGDARGGPFDAREAARIGIQAAEALAHAHAHGVMHRDIKPSNLLRDDHGIVWVADFGLAWDDSDAATLTDTGDFLGTLRYLAPERIDARGDARVDIYGLGATLYELICGRPAYPETDRAKLLKQLAHDDPPRPRSVDRRIARDLETIVLKAMARDPKRRYATASELAADLRRFLEDRPIQARRAGALEKGALWCRRNRAMAGLIGGGALALVLGTAVSSYFAVRAARGEALARRNESLALENAGRADRELTRARAEKLISDQRLYVAEMRLAGQAWREGRIDLARQYLHGHGPSTPGPDTTDRRGFEWYFLDRACRRELFTLRGHANHVMGVAFSPEGRWIASASEDHTVRTWDVRTGQPLMVFRGHEAEILDVAISPDGRRVVSAGLEGVARVWETETGREIQALRGHAGPIMGVAVRPDGRAIATSSEDQSIKLWDARTGRQVHTLQGHGETVWDVAFSPDGRRLVSGGADGTVRIWDADTGRELHALHGHGMPVWGVAFSPDARTVASAGSDAVARLWDADTGRELRALRGHATQAINVAFSPDGHTLASTSKDRSIKLWDVDTGRNIMALREHGDLVWGVAFSPDGHTLASASNDHTLKLWDVARGMGARSLLGHGGDVASLAFAPDGHLLASASKDRLIKLWDADTGRLVRTLRGHLTEARCVAFSPDGRLLASGGGRPDGAIRLWDVATGRLVHTARGHEAGVRDLTFRPDGRVLASCSSDNSVRLWDVETGRAIRALSGHEDYVTSVAFSADGRELASSSLDRTIRLWNAEIGQCRSVLRGHTAAVRRVAFGPDGRQLVSAGGDGALRLWDVETGQCRSVFHAPDLTIRDVAFSPDGRRVASNGDGALRLWEAATGLEVMVLDSRVNYLAAVAFSPDGRQLASASARGTINVWDSTPWGPESRALRVVRRAFAPLFARGLKTPEVLDRIRRGSVLGPELSRRACELAASYGESLAEYDAERRVNSLYDQALLRPEVLERLAADSSLSAPVRRRALELARLVPENPARLEAACQTVAQLSDASPDAYRRALQQAEAACRLVPNDKRLLTVLGMARYRMGRYREAIDALERARRIESGQPAIEASSNRAFRAMALLRLARDAEARADLNALRLLLKTSAYARSGTSRKLLREAEALEMNAGFPTSPFAPLDAEKAAPRSQQ